MTPRQLLSPQARAALFDPPMEVRAIVRHYTFSIKDVALVLQRRPAAKPSVHELSAVNGQSLRFKIQVQCDTQNMNLIDLLRPQWRWRVVENFCEGQRLIPPYERRSPIKLRVGICAQILPKIKIMR
jgi:hypothetical protein